MKRLIRNSSIESNINLYDLNDLPKVVEKYKGYDIRKGSGKYSVWKDHEFYGDANRLEDVKLIVDCLDDDTRVAASRRIRSKRSRITASEDMFSTYRKLFKKYPALSRMVSTGGESYYTITETKTEFELDDNGKFVQISTITKDIPIEYYLNVIDGVQFFRGLGGKETVTTGYVYGMTVPVRITSVSPDMSKKVIRSYNFTYNE